MDTKKEKKGEATFCCVLCDYYTSHKTKYEKHLNTTRHARILLDTKKGEKGEEKGQAKYGCEKCHYFTSDKTKYDRHILTAKHKKGQKGEKKDQKGQLEEMKNICVCGNAYVFQSGLYKHKKKCNLVKKDEIFVETLQKTNEIISEATSIMTNANTFLENEKVQNIYSKTKIHNLKFQKIKKIKNNFDIKIFLNEECKNAISISSFIDSIKPTLEDLENVGEKGYVKGITSIILSKLKELDVYTRPIHYNLCDIYLKEKDWETDNKKVVKFVKSVAMKNMGNMLEWKKKYPEHEDLQSVKNTRYLKLVQECIGGEDESKNTDKIIQNISKEILV
uniref:C2H2-type domain-containing protein n=1 Tax=viral metagenome TaxID=1070528 RepID=A0A6C0HT82_9ZZZZ